MKDLLEVVSFFLLFAWVLALTWNDRISFVLTESFQIKRLAFLDILKESAEQAENEDERFDIDFALMTGETNLMIQAIFSALGGIEA